MLLAFVLLLFVRFRTQLKCTWWGHSKNWKTGNYSIDTSSMYQHRPKAPAAAVVLGPATRPYNRCYVTHAMATVRYGFLATQRLWNGTSVTHQHKALAVVKVLGPLGSICSTAVMGVASLCEAQLGLCTFWMRPTAPDHVYDLPDYLRKHILCTELIISL